MSAAKKLVVCGGNGFLGSRICKHAVARGWDVTSISRSGEPQWNTVTSSATPPAWARDVAWERADILRPATYVPLLTGADFVVHSMGILLEMDYKGVISGRESPIAGLRRAFSTVGTRSPNPLEQHEPEPERRNSGEGSATSRDNNSSKPPLTYETMNRDSAILLAKESSRAGASAFGFISAAGGAPVLPSRYITTKREAERVIAREFPSMRGVFVRAPFMYDAASRPATVPLAAAAAAGSVFNGLTRGVLSDFLGSAGAKPLRADVVAEAVVEALGDGATRGPVEVRQLEELAGRSWKSTML